MTTYHYVQNQGKLIMQIQKNDQKPQFGQFIDEFQVKYLQLKIFLRNRFHSNWRLYLVLTSGQNKKKLFEPFLRKISKCLISGQIWKPFREYLQIKNFFQKSGSVTFLPL